MNTSLQGKVAVITGGSKGIGKAIAFALATEGARIAICGREELTLKQTRQELEDRLRTDVVAMKANLLKANDIRRFVEAVLKKFDRIDILVNNAGGGHVGGIMKTTDDEWEYHIQLKLMGSIRMAREVIPAMRKAGGGRIINIVGIAGKEPSPLFMVPGVTNAALLNFTKALSKEVEKDFIFVNAINPGTAETGLTGEIFDSIAELTGRKPDDIRQATAGAFPQGRLVRPEDIANAVVFLASDAASFINGISINIDAGRTAGLW